MADRKKSPNPIVQIVGTRLFDEITRLGRLVARQDVPPDPQDVGRFLAKLAELDEVRFPGAFRVEAWGGIGGTDARGMHRWRVLVAGVGYPFQPASFADFADRWSGLRNPKIVEVVRNFFKTAPGNASIAICPWAPYSEPTAGEPWVWVKTEGDRER